MNIDDVALVLLLLTAPPSTLYPIVFGLTTRWRGTLMGPALLTKSIGLALLVDLSLAYRVLGAGYQGRDVARVTVFALITVGVWMQTYALLRQKHREHAAAVRRRRTHR